jgi:hypothetical protein
MTDKLFNSRLASAKVTELRVTFAGKQVEKLAKCLGVDEITADNYDNDFIVKAILHAMKDQREVYDAAAGTVLNRDATGGWLGWCAVNGKDTSVISDTDPFYVLRHVAREAKTLTPEFQEAQLMRRAFESAPVFGGLGTIIAPSVAGHHPPGELVVTVTNMSDEEADKLGEELFDDKEDNSGD